jgi:hypothetical protein
MPPLASTSSTDPYKGPSLHPIQWGSSSNNHPKDYAVFLSPNFDANEYSNAVLSGRPYHPDGHAASSDGQVPDLVAGDVNAALAKLNVGIEDVNRQLRAEVRLKHDAVELPPPSE